ncbi:MAG: hypothetical protein HRT92_11115 [Piscirickettsiaceae bacterium]|nr:hypothetical protein [Piscirickettsiaceae bacterium]
MEQTENDHIGSFAQAFFIGNLLFVGVFYLALWGLYLFKYKRASTISQHHIKQSLLASTITTSIFAVINIVIIQTDGYASLTALLSLEIYFMFVIPLCLAAGLFAFAKAVQGTNFTYPLIGKLIK